MISLSFKKEKWKERKKRKEKNNLTVSRTQRDW
jgi:uncharacterized protein (DUF1919 family)